MSDSKTQNINVTKNTAFANMLGGYNGEKEYNKRNNPWTIDKDGNGKNEFNWSKARQTFGDLLGDVAMFGIGALSGGMDDPIRGIGQGFQNVYARRNAMNAAANNYENYLTQQAQQQADDELRTESNRQYWDFAKTNGVQGLPKTREEVTKYTFDKEHYPMYKDLYDNQATFITLQDADMLKGLTNPTADDIKPTGTVPPTRNVQTPTQGVELQLEQPGSNETLPNVLQGGVVQNEDEFSPDRPMRFRNPSTVGTLLNNFTNERNNVRNNIQSDKNSQRSYEASIHGDNVSYANAHDRIEFERYKHEHPNTNNSGKNELETIQKKFDNAMKMYKQMADAGYDDVANQYLRQAEDIAQLYPELSLGMSAGYGAPQPQSVSKQTHNTNAF